MPNRLSLPSSLQKLTHDPTKTINGDPLGILGDNAYAEMTEEIIFGAINSFLTMLKDVTGIDLTGYAAALEGIPFDMLTAVLQGQGNWTSLLSGTGVPNVEGLISLILNPVGAITQFIPDFIPVSSIVDAALNLLPDGLFQSDGSVGAGPWDWTSLFKTGQAAGSATALHDGSLLTLFSDPPTKVVAGQNLNITQAVRWEDIGSVTGSAFELGVQLFNATMQPIGGVTQIANIVNPLNDSASESGVDSNGFMNLGAGYTVPAGASYVSQVLSVNPVVATGQSWWSNGSLSRSALMPQSFVQDLPAQIADLLDKAQQQIDAIVQALIGGTGTGYILQDVKDALNMIPGANVLGAAGIPTMDGTITTMWDNVTSALKQLGLTGVTLSDFAAAAQDTSQSATSAEALAIQQTNTLGVRTNKPIMGALERTTISNMTLSALGSGSTPTNFAVTQGASAIGIVRMPEADTKGILYWRSSGNANITGFYLNFSKLALNGTVTPLFSSGNLAAQLTSGWQWQQYTMPGASKISHLASENILVEYQVVGSGTLSIAGLPMAWMNDDHPIATTKRSGGTRNTGATNAANSLSSFTFSGNTPYTALGRSDVPVDFIPADLQFFTATGTYTRPGWMVDGDILDVFLIPAGGGGQSGGYGAAGEGGTAGTWATRSYVIGSDPRGTGYPVIPMSTTVFTHTLGAPGSGGVNPYTLDPGNNASNSSVSAAGITTLTGTGGIGGGRAGNNTSDTAGQAAGNRTLHDYTAFGGTAAGVNAAGVDPGGGGGSGYPAFGNLGGHAKVWYRATQGA